MTTVTLLLKYKEDESLYLAWYQMSRYLYDASFNTELFPFVWAGKGTSQAESLQSAYRRIAFAHHVRVGTLFDFYFKPGLAFLGLTGVSHPILRTKKSFSISTDSVVVQHIACRIADLTGEIDAEAASLINLTALLSRTGLANRNNKFCPFCLEGRLDTLYGRVLWEFAAVRACPVHRIRLMQPNCGSDSSKRVPGSFAIQLNGVCHRCGRLGMRCQAGQPVDASDEELWAAKEIGELVAFASGGGELSAEGLRRGIAESFESLGAAKCNMLKEVGLSPAYIQSWILGKQRPNLPGLLALASVCSWGLVGLFRDAATSAACSTPEKYVYRSVRRAPIEDLPVDDAVVQAAFEEMLREGTECVSGMRLANRLNVSSQYLVDRFPAIWSACQLVRNDARMRGSLKRTQELANLVASAAEIRLEDMGEAITERQIRHAMGHVSRRFGEWEVATAIRKWLKEHFGSAL
ncbi:TniQ family protein [Cupriavidus sp. TMH.W2]|uniref:TniQ family protein n=1 Tax=Cupriavidus sp. TMH.W2 TaxID=3434465 RepID=UPI003D781D92